MTIPYKIDGKNHYEAIIGGLFEREVGELGKTLDNWFEQNGITKENAKNYKVEQFPLGTWRLFKKKGRYCRNPISTLILKEGI